MHFHTETKYAATFSRRNKICCHFFTQKQNMVPLFHAKTKYGATFSCRNKWEETPLGALPFPSKTQLEHQKNQSEEMEASNTPAGHGPNSLHWTSHNWKHSATHNSSYDAEAHAALDLLEGHSEDLRLVALWTVLWEGRNKNCWEEDTIFIFIHTMAKIRSLKKAHWL